MKRFAAHLKKYMLRGLLAVIPLALTWLAVRLLYSTIDQRVLRLVEKHLEFTFPGMGILLVLAVLYLLGLLTSNWLGKQVLSLVEKITNYIPLVKTTYNVGRQLASTLSGAEQAYFKRAVLVQFLKPGMWTVGFVTGTVIDRRNNDEILLKVYVPTPPNPASGTMIIVRESDTRDPGWTVEEALNAVISGGLIGSPEIK